MNRYVIAGTTVRLIDADGREQILYTRDMTIERVGGTEPVPVVRDLETSFAIEFASRPVKDNRHERRRQWAKRRRANKSRL